MASAAIAAAALLAALAVLLGVSRRRARELAAANARLARSEARLAGFIGSAHDAIVSADETGQVTLFNPAAERLTGFSSRQVIGRGVELLVPERHRARVTGLIADLVRSGEPPPVRPGEITALRSDGVEVVVEISLARHEAAGRPHFTVIARDVTERRRASAQARRISEELERRLRLRTAELSETMRELEAFTYTVSHDLRAPLRAVDGFTQVLIQDHEPALGGEAMRLLRRAGESGRQMSAMIDGLLALSRVGRVELARRKLDMTRIAREAASEAAERYPGVQFEVDELPSAAGDDRLVAQLLANLTGNAFKFSTGRPEARVRIGAVPGEVTAYYVEDNGVGFDMAHAGKLFGVFERLWVGGAYPGIGMGLAIARRIVNRHGGRLWAQAEPGRGARFSFTIRCENEGAD